MLFYSVICMRVNFHRKPNGNDFRQTHLVFEQVSAAFAALSSHLFTLLSILCVGVCVVCFISTSFRPVTSHFHFRTYPGHVNVNRNRIHKRYMRGPHTVAHATLAETHIKSIEPNRNEFNVNSINL